MKDITNQKFGMLTAVRYLKPFERTKQSNGAIWLCQCHCGKLIELPLTNWQRQQSCGCLRLGPNPKRQLNNHVNWQGTTHIPMSLFNRFRRLASKRNIEFNITIYDVESVYLKQNKKCALTGLPIQFSVDNTGNASIDRIDSSKGYTLDNIQCVLKTINMMKGTLSQSEFIKLCQQVSSFA